MGKETISESEINCLPDGLSLDKFVAVAITEITKGVIDAGNALKGLDILINPITNSNGLIDTRNKGNYRNVQQLEFDLAVSASSDSSNGVKGGIKVLGLIQAGGKSESATSSITTNKIRFAIPVSFPTNTSGITPEEYARSMQALESAIR